MGKKRRSKFVQQQKYNQHLQNKSQSNMNHAINRTNRKIESYKQDYESSIKEIMADFIKENGLDPDKIPNNSRILVYELLRKNIQNKAKDYELYIKNHLQDDNINEYYDAQKLCQDSLEQIDWIYDWTKPINGCYLGNGFYECSLLEKVEEKLKESGKKFDSVLDIPDIIDSINSEYSNNIKCSFYCFCNFILNNDVNKYYIYISNTIKNLKILNTEDPIRDFMLKPYVNE